MFQSLRPNNQLFILRKDKPELVVGSVISVSTPMPKNQMQPAFGPHQEMVVDIIAKVNNEDVTYQKIPASADIADFGNNSVVISDNREAMNAEILSLKKKSNDIINSIDYHKDVVIGCDRILGELNPEIAEKQAQQKEIDSLRDQVSEMTKNMAALMETNKQLIAQFKTTKKEKNNENVGN
jgi:uncharacterized coiled-coil protein SlyX